MTVADIASRALRIKPAALAQRIEQQLRDHRADPNPVILVRAEPVWPYEPTLTLGDGRRLRVVPCVSTLAVWEQVTQPRDTALVLLTELTERDLGIGILSQVFRQRVITVEPWDLVGEVFGARVDWRLQSESWAGEALLDAMPPEGWPRLAGTVLGRDQALRYLAAARLRLDRIGVEADDLDVRALLRWSALPGARESLDRLREAERAGLLAWLADTYGRPVQVTLALYEADHLADALPLGLVCAAVWQADGPEALRAQGRIEQYVGRSLPTPTVKAYGEAATAVVTDLLGGDDDERRTGEQVLDRAEELLITFQATAAAPHSALLRSGFDHRADVVATALLDALSPQRIAAVDTAVEALDEHHLARTHPQRVRRARMALRLIRWLAAPADQPQSVADAVDQQIREWGWVDLALAHAWAGDTSHPGLKRALGAVYERAAERRRHLDQAFAAWVAADTPPGTLLTVERILDHVVAPVVRHDKRVLLVVLDGMSAAVAADLAEDLTDQLWVEYDPLAGRGPARRRAALAAIPSVTTVSRASLFAGRLCSGGADQEKAAFESHPRWKGRAAQLFHKSAITGGAGQVLGEKLETALAGATPVVAVVINTIDDALDHGRESTDPSWRVDQVGPLRALLELASSHGRAVVITSDHGHVLDRDSVGRDVHDPASARHRTCSAPAGDGEVELVGPRVVADQNRVVAAWDRVVRYRSLRAGYHGGASLAEMTVPVLAFLPWNATPPRGWAPIAAPQPGWWSTSPTPPAATAAVPPQHPAPGAEDTLFDVEPAPAPSLVEAVLTSDMFRTQLGMTPRGTDQNKVAKALAALVEANGVLPTVVVAERAGEHPTRATGFVTILQRCFNVDNYPVLSVTDGGRTVRLDVALLREQFGVGRAVR